MELADLIAQDIVQAAHLAFWTHMMVIASSIMVVASVVLNYLSDSQTSIWPEGSPVDRILKYRAKGWY